MLIVEYQSKSYLRFLNDMPQVADHKSRFLITFNGASEPDLLKAVTDLEAYTKNTVKHSTAINDKVSDGDVTDQFKHARENQDILLFEGADILFDKKADVKNSHERDNNFNLNNLFKNIAQHHGMVVLATEKKQTLSASMSTKVDVVIRFPTA